MGFNSLRSHSRELQDSDAGTARDGAVQPAGRPTSRDLVTYPAQLCSDRLRHCPHVSALASAAAPPAAPSSTGMKYAAEAGRDGPPALPARRLSLVCYSTLGGSAVAINCPRCAAADKQTLPMDRWPQLVIFSPPRDGRRGRRPQLSSGHQLPQPPSCSGAGGVSSSRSYRFLYGAVRAEISAPVAGAGASGAARCSPSAARARGTVPALTGGGQI